ncbi:MAG: 3-methyl-2-oxobutanoate hydroxymethyltransferase [Actinobacteria bacterium]|nr:3-methyl-2-oxobutanoate hydroxymethyltransferase [Actinomycetota bacterium]
MAKKLSLWDFYEMKKNGDKITWITAYDYPIASLSESAGIDMILVGDSLGMVVYGYSGTVPVTMDECIIHCKAVRRGAPNVFVVGDMPFGSYHTSDADAVANAVRFVKEAGMDAIKLEGGVRVESRIRAIGDAGVVVIGHIGLTPQSSGVLGGFKAQGRTAESAEEVIKDAIAVEKAGAKILLVEAIPPELAGAITKIVKIPVLGIGAGAEIDGQVMICGDILGYFQAFTPKFVKKYANIAKITIDAIKEYIDDVKSSKFPAPEHTYSVLEDEKNKFENMLKKYLK